MIIDSEEHARLLVGSSVEHTISALHHGIGRVASVRRTDVWTASGRETLWAIMVVWPGSSFCALHEPREVRPCSTV